MYRENLLRQPHMDHTSIVNIKYITTNFLIDYLLIDICNSDSPDYIFFSLTKDSAFL